MNKRDQREETPPPSKGGPGGGGRTKALSLTNWQKAKSTYLWLPPLAKGGRGGAGAQREGFFTR